MVNTKQRYQTWAMDGHGTSRLIARSGTLGEARKRFTDARTTLARTHYVYMLRWQRTTCHFVAGSLDGRLSPTDLRHDVRRILKQ